jgi:hypothetical protein
LPEYDDGAELFVKLELPLTTSDVNDTTRKISIETVNMLLIAQNICFTIHGLLNICLSKHMPDSLYFKKTKK